MIHQIPTKTEEHSSHLFSCWCDLSPRLNARRSIFRLGAAAHFPKIAPANNPQSCGERKQSPESNHLPLVDLKRRCREKFADNTRCCWFDKKKRDKMFEVINRFSLLFDFILERADVPAGKISPVGAKLRAERSWFASKAPLGTRLSEIYWHVSHPAGFVVLCLFDAASQPTSIDTWSRKLSRRLF